MPAHLNLHPGASTARPTAGRARRRSALAPLLIAAALAGCATPQPASDAGAAADADSTRVTATLEAGGKTWPAHWHLPREPARALVLLEHGFLRSCERLRETSRQLAAAGLMVLCIDAPMTAGNPALAEALAAQVENLQPPGGQSLPATWLVAGHSAGAAFALRLGATLHARTPQRLAGALLFDPVSTRDFEADLLAVSDGGRRPVLALLAQPHGCNAQGDALPALRRARTNAATAGAAPVDTVQFGPGSTHADVEGEDSNWLATSICGTPEPTQVAALRTLAVHWAGAVTQGHQDLLPPPPAGEEPRAWRLAE